jgi:MoaA/NifB/PqqE/SkfB family radical SAM enzyme
MGNCDSLPVPGGASGPARTAILQIHASLRCNLSCAHCYSSSGPLERTELDVATICKVISDAAEMGYRVVSMSGGEPLMYGGLDEVLGHAKSLNMFTTVTTNGFFSTRKRLDNLYKLVDGMAISLDGPPDFHNEIRGSALAFERLEAGLVHMREAGIPFGFIHTLTQRNWEHLLWVAEFAAGNGARLLQVHPLELAGHAESQMAGQGPEIDVLAKVYVLAFALASKYSGIMKVQIDLLYRDYLREEPALVYAGEPEDKWDQAVPAQLLGLLVLEADGTVVPVSYGFARQFQLCNVREQGLADAWPGYLSKGYPHFRALCRQVWGELSAPDAPLLSNWHEVIASRSKALSTEGAAIQRPIQTDLQDTAAAFAGVALPGAINQDLPH